MPPRLIDLDSWERREFYLHFMNEVVCTWSATVELDITPLEGQRLYPAMLWLLTDTVDRFPEFRTTQTPRGPGVFDAMTPSYTIFNRERKSFSAIWTEFSPDYREFLARYAADVERYQTSAAFAPKPGKPENCFDVSMLPWMSFTSFNIHVYNDGHYLLPIFTMGKKFVREGRTLLPLALQVHHAVCDGYHAGAFLEALQAKINTFQGV